MVRKRGRKALKGASPDASSQPGDKRLDATSSLQAQVNELQDSIMRYSLSTQPSGTAWRHYQPLVPSILTAVALPVFSNDPAFNAAMLSFTAAVDTVLSTYGTQMMIAQGENAPDTTELVRPLLPAALSAAALRYMQMNPSQSEALPGMVLLAGYGASEVSRLVSRWKRVMALSEVNASELCAPGTSCGPTNEGVQGRVTNADDDDTTET